MMDENFDWREYEESEVKRVLTEIEEIDAIEKAGGAAAYPNPNRSGESTLKAFVRAMDVSIDAFAEKTKNLR
jgi:hypothetical protein